jgi:outer membrane lipoprotein LolB
MPSFVLRVCLLAATILIAACAHKQGSAAIKDTQKEVQNGVLAVFWAGRISLQLQSEPPQAFFAGFELKGQADNGELTLISPLGSILGIMRWTPSEAVLEQNGSIKRFASTDELLAQTTGAAVPVSALFDWLSGKNTTTPGWLADLSQQGNGRITAKRTAPAPQADLRIVLDKR